MMKLNASRLKSINTPLLALLGMLLALLVASLNAMPAPEINTEFEGATIQISADRGWSLSPFDCINVRWHLEGIKSVYIDDVGKIGWGELIYCPPWDGSGPDFRITAQNGAVDTFTLDLSFGPNELLNCLLFVTILTLFLLAVYFLLRYRLDKPLPLTWSSLILFAIAVAACLLGSANGILSIPQILQDTGQVFASPAWQFIGLILCALVFIPLLIQKLRAGIRAKAIADFAAIAAFLLFLLLLYLPFGFESIGHWEEWVSYAYLEGRPSKLGVELVSRFWILVPHQLAIVISPDSFVGFHLVNLLMFWATMALLYGVLRQLKFSPYVAFLCSLLFLVYPVNSQLMSLRSFSMTFGKVALLAGTYLVLEYRSKQSRLRLLGIWLALLFGIGSYDSGYAIILVVPLLWLLRIGLERRNYSVAAIWYLFPAAKVAYLLLLLSVDQLFYASRTLSASLVSERTVLDAFAYYLDIVGKVYLQTFAIGWQDALIAVSQNMWIAPTVAALFITGITALYLARDPEAGALPSWRQASIALLGGTAFVLPSIGVLMWFERYNQDLWRMYVYVPIGAAVAIISLLLLLTSLLGNPRIRKLAIVVASLLLMFPATSRLFVQHADIVDSANAKANALRQIIEQAPAIESDAFVILVSELDLEEMRSNDIWEFKKHMFDGSVYVLYGGYGPRHAFLCINDSTCHLDDIAFKEFELEQNVDFSNLVIFRLHEDLTVELLRELPPELGLDDRGSYNPDRLIDYAAPLPPRAVSMLGAGR